MAARDFEARLKQLRVYADDEVLQRRRRPKRDSYAGVAGSAGRVETLSANKTKGLTRIGVRLGQDAVKLCNDFLEHMAEGGYPRISELVDRTPPPVSNSGVLGRFFGSRTPEVVDTPRDLTSEGYAIGVFLSPFLMPHRASITDLKPRDTRPADIKSAIAYRLAREKSSLIAHEQAQELVYLCADGHIRGPQAKVIPPNFDIHIGSRIEVESNDDPRDHPYWHISNTAWIAELPLEDVLAIQALEV